MKCLLALLLAGAPALAGAQPPTQARPATIRGRVVLADGRPARRATVRLIHVNDAFHEQTSTDSAGQYEFTTVAPGEYRLSAGKAGYQTVEYGQPHPREPGTLLSLASGDVLDHADIALPGASAISGRVFDENGDAVGHVSVALLETIYAGNRRQLAPVAGVGARTTDDQGHYRLYAIPPGQYMVVARPADSPLPTSMPAAPLPPGYVPTYFPGTPNGAAARTVSIGSAQEVANIDFALARTGTARVSGTIVNSAGAPTLASVSLVPSTRSGRSATAESFSKATSADGAFDIRNVPPGDWVIQASAARPIAGTPGPEGEFASQTIVVAGDGTRDLRLQLSAGSTVSGHVTFEGAAGDVDVRAFTIGTVPTDPDRTPLVTGVLATPAGAVVSTDRATPTAMPSTGTSAVQADGTFELAYVNGPRRFRLVKAPPQWSIRQVTVNGQDTTDRALPFGSRADSLTNVEIVLTSRSAAIAGVVTMDGGQPAPGCAVLVFATEAERWYQGSRFMGFARAKADGSFAVPNLPGGDYYVAAVDRLQGDPNYGEWQDPDVLAALAPRASKVFLADGQSLPVAPRLIAR